MQESLHAIQTKVNALNLIMVFLIRWSKEFVFEYASKWHKTPIYIYSWCYFTTVFDYILVDEVKIWMRSS